MKIYKTLGIIIMFPIIILCISLDIIILPITIFIVIPIFLLWFVSKKLKGYDYNFMEELYSTICMMCITYLFRESLFD